MGLRFATLYVGHNACEDILKKYYLFTASPSIHETHLPPVNSRNSSWQQELEEPYLHGGDLLQPFKRRIKFHLPFADIIRSSPCSPR